MGEDRKRRVGRWPWALAATLVIALVAVLVTVDGDDGEPSGDSTQSGSTAQTGGPDAADGDGEVRIMLREGQAAEQADEDVPVTEGTALPPERIDAVIDRLDPFAGEESDRQEFVRPAESLLPPTAGETIPTAFPPVGTEPPADAPDQSPTGPLEVLRVQPEGEVDIAPSLSVTFDQPMVPLTTLDQLDAADVPVTVTPELDGRWRWIGTRTLRFEHTAQAIDRLPMATEYTVTVPAGTTSETGGTLAEDVTFTFSTPPPTVQGFGPESDSLPLTPVFVAVFDQLVDPDAVLDHLTVDADGDRAIRLATDTEVDADDTARELVDQALDGRWVAFRPTDPLPADTPVTITFDEGTPSAEGPRTTTADQTFRGRTFPPLTITGTECGFGGTCRPGEPLIITFSNPLDAGAFDPAGVTADPAIPGMTASVRDAQLVVQGGTEADTTYAVTVPAGLRDDRGQTLGQDETREFDVGDPRPFLRRFDTDLVTLDPLAEDPSLALVSAGHTELRVVTLDVGSEDWDAYLRLDRHGDRIAVPDFPVTSDEVIDTGADDGTTVETIVDLAEAVGDDGQALVYVEPTREFPPNSEEFWENRPLLIWVQDTHIGIDALADGQRLLVWTTDLRDGSPIADASVTYGDQSATTDGEGLASFDLDTSGAAAITATAEGQTALLSAGYVERWTAQPRRDVTRWYTLDDRGLYRPGETVQLKGWVRRLQLSQDADLALPGEGTTIDYQVYDGQYAEIATGEVTLDAFGAFDLSVDLPEGANLGQGAVSFQLTGVDGLEEGYWEHPLRIEEFRRPEFEVTTSAVSTEPHVVTSPVTVAAEATYFAGGGLAGAPVTWTVSHAQTAYSPPGWEGFSFGVFVPWWYAGGFEDGFGGGFETEIGPCCGPEVEETVERFDGVTDAQGRHHLEIDIQGDAPDLPLSVSANAAVTDVNRQSFASTTDLLVHAGERYLGLRSDRAFVRQGDPLRIDAVLTDIDGQAVAGEPVTLTAERLVEEYVDGEYTETAVDPQTCEVTSADEPERCEFDTTAGGRYRISGTVTDPDGGMNRTEYEVWVAGSEEIPTRRVTQEQLTLIPAEQEYLAGDLAEILVPAPFSPATGLVTITRNGIESTQVIEVTEGSAVVEIPLTDDMIPNIEVRVDLVGAAPRVLDDGSPAEDLPDRPAFASGTVSIAVPPTSRTLTVDAVPRDEAVEPGASTAVDVTVTDADGTPVEGADVAVVVVDEALLSLIGRELQDPVDAFYSPHGTYLDAELLRRTLVLSRSDALGTAAGGGEDEARGTADDAADDSGGAAEEEAASEALADGDALEAEVAQAAPAPTGGDGAAPPIEVRSDFDALAVFAPSLTTDASGRTSVDVDVPDSLTRYRVIAVAAHGADRFGKGESTLTARLPLQVRPSAPRFANFGDAFELPVVLHNQTDANVDADVVLETANLTAGEGGGDGEGPVGRAVTVPAGDRVEIRFPVTTVDAGTARYRVTAVAAEGAAGGASDSSAGSFPVYTPTTSESFATYGVVDAGAVAQPVQTPEGVIPQFGGLEVTTSSTALQSLTDAVLYLEEYPYASSDALASRLLAIAALRDVLAAFEAQQLPPPEEIEATAAADVEGLVGLQNDDGGWPVWDRSRPTEPYHSIQATHALVAAREAGYAVPQGTIDSALGRLRTIEDVIDPEWGEATRQTLRAYAVHVRALAGDRDPARAAEIHAALEGLEAGSSDEGASAGLPLDALAWLWPVVDDPAIAADIAQTFANQVTETPSAATFTTGYGEDAHLVLASDRRTDGIILDAYLAVQPGSDLVPKIVNGLIANQRQGRWENVQENAFILLALKRYFDTFEATTPDFVARVWLGDLYAAEHGYAGRSVDSTLTVVPTAELLTRDDPQLVVAKDGEGRLYYRLGLRTAPDDLQLEPRDEGFVVERTYEAVGDPGDVVRDADGVWRVAPGAEVRVTVTMVADSRRVNMALVDPLPAGFEAVNPALAASPALPPDPPSEDEGDGGCCVPFGISWYPTWYDHQNLRDDRVEAFSGFLPAGTYEYSYIARATTPGTFVVPPAVAEEIYTPEVFGRTATDTVVVGG
ncbi:alpha-2-macroglobulin family protein [Euzebya sp.]|uniref:alpha-2-macroglobulin family protein n=1 Tax=Euzebya sp. TaxID=1971409 RepID=UPI0035131474